MGGYLNHCSSECTAALQDTKELKQTNSQLKFIISNKKQQQRHKLFLLLRLLQNLS